MLRDLVNEAVSYQGLRPQTLTVTSQGSSCDMSNAEISTNMIVSVGAFAANTTAVTVQCEESTNGSTGWTAISGMVVTVTTSNTHTVVRGLRTYRYARANCVTVTGTTPSYAIAVEIIGQAKYTGTGGGTSRSPST